MQYSVTVFTLLVLFGIAMLKGRTGKTKPKKPPKQDTSVQQPQLHNDIILVI